MVWHLGAMSQTSVLLFLMVLPRGFLRYWVTLEVFQSVMAMGLLRLRRVFPLVLMKLYLG